MQHGDLSNETPKRLIVVLDYIALPLDRTGVRRWRKPTPTDYKFLPATLANLLRINSKYGLLIELAAIGVDAALLEQLMARLDAGQAHPFTHAIAYGDVAELVATLPYRPEVLGVVDEAQRGLMYGSRYMSLHGL